MIAHSAFIGVATPPAELARLFAVQRAAFARERYPALATRRDRLARLLALIVANEQRFVEAVERDFGHRSVHETRLAELYIVACLLYTSDAADE